MGNAMHRKTCCAAAGLLLIVGGLAAATARAQGAFAQEVGTDPVALARKVDLSLANGNADGDASGRGPRPYLQALGGLPKRVGLVSFYVWDCGNKRENVYNPVYKYKYTQSTTDNAAGAFASMLHDASIAGLKQTFSGFGMTLLTPPEFLDTPEKRAAYEGFKLQVGGMDSFFRTLQNKDQYHGIGAADGYRLMELVTVGDTRGHHFDLAARGIGVEKIAVSLGHDLATSLGLDAVAVLYNVVQADNRTISLVGSYLYLFGPNPVADKGESLYWSGHEYSGVQLRFEVPFVKTSKKGDLESADYEGYAVIPEALALRMGQHLQERSRPKQ
jgi:hypothetical protein